MSPNFAPIWEASTRVVQYRLLKAVRRGRCRKLAVDIEIQQIDPSPCGKMHSMNSTFSRLLQLSWPLAAPLADQLCLAAARHLDGVLCNGVIVLLAPNDLVNLVVVDASRAECGDNISTLHWESNNLLHRQPEGDACHRIPNLMKTKKLDRM